jgi:hypothetical protein
MHDWVDVASDTFAAIFRVAEEARRIRFHWQTRIGSAKARDESKDYQTRRARSDHDRSASNEG